MFSEGSLGQGSQFAEMTKSLHGGSRKNMRKNKKMSVRKSKSNRKLKNMRGGSFFTPYADYKSDFSNMLPNDMTDLAKISSLNAKFEELPAVERAAGVMMGGSRRNNKKSSSRNRKTRNNKKSRRNNKRNYKGGSAPIDEPTMLVRTQTEELDARLNPQWYTENTVVPNFRGPIPIPGGTTPAPLAPAPPSPKVGGKRRFMRR